MRINRLHIQHFKAFAEQTFVLNPQFTVFVGNNATGKTTVLDALSIAIGTYFLGMDNGIPQNARWLNRKEIYTDSQGGEPLPQLPVSIIAEGEVHSQMLTWKRELTEITEKLTLTSTGAKSLKALAKQQLIARRKHQTVTLPLIAYHGTGRLWAEHNDKIAYKADEEGPKMAYSKCLSPKSSSSDFLSWFKTYEDEVRKFDQPREKLLLRVFKETITAMIPNWDDMSFSFKDEDLVGTYTDAEGNKAKLFFGQLSDGYRNMIGMVADLAYRCIKLNPHLGENAVRETPGIVLIDEIDLHLHPTWQRHIVADLKRVFPNVQFVATTHSPFIVQSLRADEVVNLDGTAAVADFWERNVIESIAYMGVESQRSVAFDEKVEDAVRFSEKVAKAQAIQTQDSADFEQIHAELEATLEKYASDPAFVAHLKIQKLAALGK